MSTLQNAWNSYLYNPKTKAKLISELESFAMSKSYDFGETESVSGSMAETNAVDWDVDEVTELEITECDNDKISFTFNFTMSGEQMEDRGPVGDSISGSARMTVNRDETFELSTNAQVDPYGSDK